jgi:hypothetical protein
MSMSKKKISQSNSKHSKTTKAVKEPAVAEAIPVEDELKDSPLLVDKKVIDIESALEPAALIDEKEVEDLPIPTDDSEDGGDEVSLDDEELNPFGDKWEQ